MNKKLFLPVIGLFILAACNNSGSDKEKNKDSTGNTMGNDSMNHMGTSTGTVPDLPAVPEGAKVVFSNLKNDATITSPFKLMMGTEVIKVDTAGPVIAGIGHHHLFIDAEDSLPAGTIVPKDATHIHFGKGQTEYELVLKPGKHKLTLQMADGLHRSYGSKLSATVMVNVK